MASARTWISGFLTRHRARFSPNDWPDPNNSEENLEFVRGWVTAMNLKEITEQEADRASLDLVMTPPRFRPEHIPAIVKAVEGIRKAKGQTGNGIMSDSREAAERASQECDDCCGKSGLTYRWHPAPNREQRIGPTLIGYCGCPLGRWVKKTHAQHNPELSQHLIDVTEENSYAVSWLRNPPEGYSLGGHRYDSEPPVAVKETPKPAAPRRWTDPPEKPPVPIAAELDRAAINATFKPKATARELQPF